ncbi:beta-propeller fold lactonase family protein [Paenibacillus alvei]|uniref:YVTN family beta-propeller repeat protein n=1 Tax=Paenibacillus alvei TaxID=44250 RepID=UPI00148E4F01|nr:YncE family protein [Paenibacillus alvei]NEZ45224.1 beta-propeller fold lactonase family protein [Paenibacillus alvei]
MSDDCLRDLRKKLNRLQGQVISVTLSGCCDSIQGRVSRVEKESIILTGEFGTSLISLCAVSSIGTCRVLSYVTNSGVQTDPGNTVSVIDTLTDTVIATIQVGNAPIGVAITPDGQQVYVANQLDNTVSVIDTSHNKVIATLRVGIRPLVVAITPDGKSAYVTNAGTQGVQDKSISVIDTKKNKVVATITEGVGIFPFGIAIGNTPAGTRAYVANTINGTVSVLDVNPASPTFNTIIATLTVGNSPIDVAITPDGTSAFVTNADDDTVSVIDTATNAVTTIQVGDGPAGVGTGNTPNGTRVYVLNSEGDTISVIDADPNSSEFNTVIATITKGVGDSPSDAALTPDGRKVYVPNNFSNTVSVINTETNTIITSIPVGNIPNIVAVGRVCSEL